MKKHIEYANLTEWVEDLVREDLSHKDLMSLYVVEYPDERYRTAVGIELQKRALEKIERSSRSLEKLTRWLIALTVVLAALTGLLVWKEGCHTNDTAQSQDSIAL